MGTEVNAKNFRTDLFVQAQAGRFKTAKGGNTYTQAGFQIGAELGGKGSFARAKVGAGNTLNVNFQAGHEFNIGQNMGLEISANVDHVRNNKETHNYVASVNEEKNSFNGETEKNTTLTMNDITYHDGYTKAGGRAMFNLKNNRGKIGFGVEGGYRQDRTPNVTIGELHTSNTTDTDKNGTHIDKETFVDYYQVNHKNSNGYVTPRIEGELNLDKKGKWQATANADLYGGEAGIRYNF